MNQKFPKQQLDQLNRLSSEAYKEAHKHPIAVVLDNVRSMNNVGAVFRSADCFRVEKLVLCGITATPPHRDIRKTAIGAEDTVHWEYCETTAQAVRNLKDESYQIIAIEQTENSTDLKQYQPGGKVALVFGNEVDGVSDEVLNLCDSVVEIPQFGTKHSFNVAVSAGIVLWEVFNKME